MKSHLCISKFCVIGNYFIIQELSQVCFFPCLNSFYARFVIYHKLKTVLKLHSFLVTDKPFIWGEKYVGGETVRLA